MAGGVTPAAAPELAAANETSAAPTAGSRRADIAWAAGFMVVGLVTRLFGHLDSGLWFDEIWTLLDFIRLPLGELLVTYGSDNNHPLYSLLAWLSVHAFGESAFSLRLPALLFGAASLGMLYWLAKDVTGRAEARLATTLLLLSYHHVWFSQNARGYTILLFCTLGATHFFLRNLERGAGAREVVLQGLLLALGTFAHASAVFVAVGQLVAYVVWRMQTRAEPDSPRWHALYGLLAGGALSLLMHAGILGDLIDYFAHGDAATAEPVQSEANAQVDNEWKSPLWTLTATAESLGLGLVPGLLALLGGVSVLGIGGLSYLRQRAVVALAFVLPAMGSVMMLALGRPLRPRFLFFEAGFLMLFVVRGMFVTCDFATHSLVAARLSQSAQARVATWLRRAAGTVAVAAFVAILPRAYLLPKQDFEGAMAYAKGLLGEDAAVMTVGLTVMPYRDYYQADFVPVESVAELERAARGKSRAYVLHTIPLYLEAYQPALARWLAKRATEVRRFAGSMGDGDIIVYEIRPE